MKYINIVLFLYIITKTIKGFGNNGSISENVYQKMAKVLYFNPMYVTDLNVFTYRINRQTPYRTTFNLTLLTSWDNSYVIQTELYNSDLKLEIIRLAFMTCDTLSQAWVAKWLSKHSDINPKICPIPKGTYHILRAELPPENFPIPKKMLPKGHYVTRVEGQHYLNNTHKNIMYKLALEFIFTGY